MTSILKNKKNCRSLELWFYRF